jgi:hypothetical protein
MTGIPDLNETPGDIALHSDESLSGCGECLVKMGKVLTRIGQR